jgi:hypothetical protein
MNSAKHYLSCNHAYQTRPKTGSKPNQKALAILILFHAKCDGP